MSDVLFSPLHDRHVALGAKFSEFGGWSMPLQYSGVMAEHRAVRESVGVFDVSHLGKARVSGAGALDFLNDCLANDLNRIKDGQAQYTLCCNATGGVIDDLIAYRFNAEDIFLIPNAANTARVVELLQAAAPTGITVTNLHSAYAVIAVQGTYADETLAALNLPTEHDYMSFEVAKWDATELTVCRTGYTGERGYELVVPSDNAAEIWDAILAAGKSYDILPAGLGARDTLRTEMGYALHGHELTEQISPLEGGVSWAVGWKKNTFWGAEALRAQREAGKRRHSRGLRALDKGIPRPEMTVLLQDSPAGIITSGTFSPTLNIGIALALFDEEIPLGTKVGVQIRNRVFDFEVTEPPFVASHVRQAAAKP